MNCTVKKGSIHYQTYVEGFPLLIFHSMGTDFRSMRAWVEPIFKDLQGFKRIYVDLPAHGESMIDESVRSTDDILGNILDFIDQMLPEQAFSLIGFSFGGYIAQGILHYRREQVRSICLLAPALHLRERTLPERVVLLKDEKLLELLDPEVKIAYEALMTFQDKETLACFLNEIQPGRLLANRDFLTSNWRETGYFFSENLFSDVKELQQIALIVTGKQDSICGYKDQFYLVDKFPNSTYVVLDGAGHMLPIEKRKTVQALVRDWIERGMSLT